MTQQIAYAKRLVKQAMDGGRSRLDAIAEVSKLCRLSPSERADLDRELGCVPKFFPEKKP